MQSMLAAVSKLLNSSGVGQWRMHKATGAIDDFHSWGHQEAAQRDYAAHFYRLDPALTKGLTYPAGRWVMDAGAMDPRIASHREYVHDFCRPHGIGNVAGVKILETADVVAVFSLQRPPRAGVFEEDRDLMSRLLPHLMRSARLSGSIELLTSGKAILESTLNKLTHAVCVVARDGRLAYANAAAPQAFSRPGLRIRHGRLGGSDQRSSAELQRALAAAFDPPRVASAFRLEGSGDQVVVAPLPDGHPVTAAGREPFALIFMGHDARPHRDEILQGLFGLTKAEARLAHALGSGEMLESIHRRTGRSMATLRTQVARIFEKTNVSGQGPLVALLRKLPTLAAEDRSARAGTR
jgi:DNA-binding CsgD family transcriptional regulator